MSSYKTYKLLSLLLSYPENIWLKELDKIKYLLNKENVFSNNILLKLNTFIDELKQQQELDLQTKYVELFDQTPSLSLHLFEHILGDSKERGLALSDLSELYQSHGFILQKNELPDYLPVFLEFLGELHHNQAKQYLTDIVKVINLLGFRLNKLKVSYSNIFIALLNLLDKKIEVVIEEKPPKSIDEAWNEPEINFLKPTFNSFNGCMSNLKNSGELLSKFSNKEKKVYE